MIQAGEFDAPGAGSFSYTDLEFTPTAVLFFGSNKSGEDTIDTSSGSGLFMGFVGNNYDTLLLTERSVSWALTRASSLRDCAIHMLDSSGSGTQYEANIVSLDNAGFTLNFTVAAPAGRKIKFLAFGGEAQTASNERWSGDGDGTITVGWRPQTNFAFTHRDGEGDGVSLIGGTYWVTLAMMSWPETGTSDTGYIRANYNSTVQYNYYFYQQINNTYLPIGTPGVIGTITSGELDMYPTGANLDQIFYDWQGGTDNWMSHIFLDIPSSEGVFATVPSAVDATATDTLDNPNVEEVHAVFFMVSTEYTGVGSNNADDSVIGLGVATPDYQGCVLIDGDSGCLYQSSTKGWADFVDSSSVIAGVVDFENAPPNEIMIKTTAYSGAPTNKPLVYLAMVSDDFVPGFFRIR